MNAVGIDVSKGESMVVVMRPFGEIVISPFEVTRSACELSKLADLLKSLPGETKIVMECTGSYHIPVANALNYAGIFVSTYTLYRFTTLAITSFAGSKPINPMLSKLPIMQFRTGSLLRLIFLKKMSEKC